MPMSVFINLPVRDLAAARRYYKALGYTDNPNFTDESAAAQLTVSDTVVLMLFTWDKFQSLSLQPIADPKTQIQCFHTLTVDTRSEVDAIADAAIAAGGVQHSPADDEGFMYSRPVIDPDGHVWNYLWMDMSAMAGDPAA